jgi:hypothetical protein
MHEISPAIEDIAEGYTAAWCSLNPAKVASFLSPSGWLAINGAPPSVGHAAISEAARSFMRAFPDLRVKMDRLVPSRDRIEYHWTLTGINSGPGGSGNSVHISGFESWRLGPDGLIEESQGSFDLNDYERQITGSARS